MANIVIKELLAADTVSDLVDKVNFNFDQLLLNGGGPVGMIGSLGPLGPAGPRGAIWFTLYDIYNTSLTTSTSPADPYFPLWNPGLGPQRVNDILQAGFPQWKGDPTRYQPVATTSLPNTYPSYSFTIGTVGKLPRSGDFYLQETDDTFNSYASHDGDVWEYNGVLNTWTFTGVNIKGNTGSGGSTGATDWIRTTDATFDLHDILRPKVTAGHSADVRLLLGIDDVGYATEVGGTYTANTLTLYQDSALAAGGYQIAMTDDSSDTSLLTGITTSDYARIGTLNNILNIQGFGDTLTGSQISYGINIEARAGDVVLTSNNVPGSTLNTATLGAFTRSFDILNAELQVTVDPNMVKNGAPQSVQHYFSDGEVGLSISHNQSTTFGGWPYKAMRINSYDPTFTNGNDIIFQDQDSIQADLWRNVGIGEFASNRPNARLSITTGYTDNSSIRQAALAIGPTWAANGGFVPIHYTQSTNPTMTSRILKSAFIEGGLVVGRGSSDAGYPTMPGVTAITSMGNISLTGPQLIGFNSFIDKTGSLAGTGGAIIKNSGFDTALNESQAYFIGNSDSLLYYMAGSQQSDLVGRFVIGGDGKANVVSQSPLSGGLQGSQSFNINLIIDSVQSHVGINTSYIDTSDFTAAGGAHIGKFKHYTSDTLVGHIDNANQKNIILGYPVGTTSADPYIDITNSYSTDNSIYMTTPVWSSSMQHSGSSVGGSGTLDNTLATLSSFADDIGNLTYIRSIRSQTKIVHSNSVNLAGYTGQLAAQANPYNTGTGLEIETKAYYISPSVNLNQRTPIVSLGNNNYITGNRSIVVTRRTQTNILDPLFQITPFGNTSIGTPIMYPKYSIFEINIGPGNNTLLFAPTGTAITLQGAITLGGNTARNWEDGTPDAVLERSFVIPSMDRSLHVGYITSKQPNLYQDSIDTQMPAIKAGILIDNIVFSFENTFSSSVNVEDIYKGFIYRHYTRDGSFAGPNIGYYRPQITTPVQAPKSLLTSSGNTYEYVANSPLAIKPGLLVDPRSGLATPTVNAIKMLKGADTLISAGDVLMARSGTTPPASIKAGDVYVFAGAIYSSSIGGTGGDGYNIAKEDITSSQLYDEKERRNVGNIFIGSRPDQGSEILTTSGYGVTRAGLVYMGYSSLDATTITWNKSTTTFSPKGTATLNVSANTEPIISTTVGFAPLINTYTRTATYSMGLASTSARAINIQYGDIVTKNQDAGWIVLDLTKQPFLNTNSGFSAGSYFSWTGAPIANPASAQVFQSNVLRIYYGGSHGNGQVGSTFQDAVYWDSTGANRGGGTMTEVKPRWEIRYKVIGYTVFYQITLLSVLCATVSLNTGTGIGANNSGMLSLYGPALFNIADANGNRLPRPKVSFNNTTTSDSVYPASNSSATTPDNSNLYGQNSVPFAGIGGAVIQPTFGGSGVAVWRNARNLRASNGLPYPLSSGGTAPFQTTQSQNSPILVTPISAAFTVGNPLTRNNADPWIHLYKIGTPTFPQYGANATNGLNIHNSMFRLWCLDGRWDDGSTQGMVNATGGMLQMDFTASGQYELDPTWFNT